MLYKLIIKFQTLCQQYFNAQICLLCSFSFLFNLLNIYLEKSLYTKKRLRNHTLILYFKTYCKVPACMTQLE